MIFLMPRKLVSFTSQLDTQDTGVLIKEFILQMRKQVLNGVHHPFRHLSHCRRLLLPLEVQPLLLVKSWCVGMVDTRQSWEELMRKGRFTFPKSEATVHFPPVSSCMAPSLSYTLPQCVTWLSCTDPGMLKKAIGIVPSGQKTKTDVT